MPSQLWASSNSDQWQQEFGHLDNGRNCHKYIEKGSLGPELPMMVMWLGRCITIAVSTAILTNMDSFGETGPKNSFHCS